MRTTLAVIAAIIAGATLGVGITWARFGTSTSADALQIKPLDAGRSSNPSALPSTNGAGASQAVAEETEFDFGPVERNSKVRHDFVISNAGNVPLTLANGGTSCAKCTIAALERKTIEPGGSASVTVEYHAAVAGPQFRQSATVLTNDPRRPRIELTVKGTISAVVALEPHELVFSELSVHDTRTLETKLINHLTDSVNITGHSFEDEAAAPFFDVAFKPLTAEDLKPENAKSGQLISVTIKPGLPMGLVRQKLTLQTDLPGNRSMELPILATITSDISISGYRWDEESGVLQIGAVPSKQGAKREVFLSVRGPHRDGVKVSVGEVTPEFLRVAVGEQKSINEGAVVRIPVTIEIPPGSPAAAHLGSKTGKPATVILNTTHPEVKQIKLLVRFAVHN